MGEIGDLAEVGGYWLGGALDQGDEAVGGVGGDVLVVADGACFGPSVGTGKAGVSCAPDRGRR